MKLVPHEVILVSEIPPCYFCEENGFNKPGPYDFATFMGPWANGCERHWREYRAAPTLGTGRGQLWVTRDQLGNPDLDDPKPGTVGAMLNGLRDPRS